MSENLISVELKRAVAIEMMRKKFPSLNIGDIYKLPQTKEIDNLVDHASYYVSDIKSDLDKYIFPSIKKYYYIKNRDKLEIADMNLCSTFTDIVNTLLNKINIEHQLVFNKEAIITDNYNNIKYVVCHHDVKYTYLNNNGEDNKNKKNSVMKFM